MIIRLLWKQWKLWYQQKIRHVRNKFKLHMRAFNFKKSRWSYIKWWDMQKYLKIKWWTKWLMMHMICFYHWLSISILKWWWNWHSYRNKSDKHKEYSEKRNSTKFIFDIWHQRWHIDICNCTRIMQSFTMHYWRSYAWEKLTSINFYIRDEYLMSLWWHVNATKIKC